MTLKKQIQVFWRKMVCNVIFLGMATSVLAAGTDSVISYHWQPTEGYTINGTTATIPALISAGSYSPLAMTANFSNLGIWLKKDTANTAMWLDTAADGYRYVCALGGYRGTLSIRAVSADGSTMANQTIFVPARRPTSFAISMLKIRQDLKAFSVMALVRADSLIVEDLNHSSKVIKSVPLNLMVDMANGTWVPFYLRLEDISADSIGVRVGVADREVAYVKCPSGTATINAGLLFCQVSSGDISQSAADSTNEASDVHLFCSNYATQTAAVLWSKYFAVTTIPGPIGHVPLLIHNIIYDPPGAQSYETCQFDTSTATQFDFNCTRKVSGSVEIGVKSSVSIGEGVAVNVAYTATGKAEAHYAYVSDSSCQVSLSTSTSTSSMTDDVDSIFIGPSFGDVVVYQKFVYQVIMMKHPVMSRFMTATNPQDYVWAVAGTVPVPDSCSTVHYTPIRTLLTNLNGDTALLSFLQREYPYDLTTGKLLASAFLPGRNGNGDSVGARIGPLTGEGTYDIGGTVQHSSSVTREQIIAKDTAASFGASLTADFALWTPGPGAEIIVSGGLDFSCTTGGTSGTGSTIFYNFQDNTPWNIFRITPLSDYRFGTVLFNLDSANSYSSFPYEANTRHAVTWNIASMPACTGFVGQATVVTIAVTNTSPKSILAALPNAFPFTVSAINFPGTYTVYPENVEIGTNQTVTFTCTFTGASAGTFAQQMKITCISPSSGNTMSESRVFSLTMKKADVGLVVSNPQDTIAITRGSTIFNTFKVKLINVGVLASNILFGADSASAGTTVSYGSITNPVAAGDTATLAVSLTGNGTQNYYTASYWAQIEGEPTTKSHHTLVIKMQDPTGVVHGGPAIIRELGLVNLGGGRLEVLVPASESPTLRLFSFNGRMVLSQHPVAGRSILDIRAQHLSNGYYILRLQGKKLIQQKILVSGKR
jgi:hypothetical protein